MFCEEQFCSRTECLHGGKLSAVILAHSLMVDWDCGEQKQKLTHSSCMIIQRESTSAQARIDARAGGWAGPPGVAPMPVTTFPHRRERTMARRRKNFDDYRREWAEDGPLVPRREPPGSDAPLSIVELMTAVCERFCQGKPTWQIQKELKELFGKQGNLTRERIFSLVRRAAHEGWFSYRPPPHFEYAALLRDRYPLEGTIDVVSTVALRDVAVKAAEVMLEIIEEQRDRDELHIGLAGGTALRRTVRHLARLMQEPLMRDRLPRRIVFHSLVADLDQAPLTDPGSFFAFFDRPEISIEVDYVVLPAPGFLRPAAKEILSGVEPIADVVRKKSEIDILLTSGADWSDEHTLLRQFMTRNPAPEDMKAVEDLEKQGCVGDILWQPIGPDGPLTTETRGRQAFTLFKLDELPGLIRDGKKVVLVLGPCGACARPKGDLLWTVLEQRPTMITHLVTDTRTAARVYDRVKGAEPDQVDGAAD